MNNQSVLLRFFRRLSYFRVERYVKKQRVAFQNRLTGSGDNKKIFLFCTPTHSNLGDQAQLMCWLRLFEDWYPSYQIMMVATKYREFKTIRSIRKCITQGDKIFIHSGYLIFDPHPELPFILDVVRAFYDYPITILPQTINLIGDWYQQVVARQFNAHQNLTLLCRDEVSFEKAKRLFPKVSLKLMPDVVTSLIGDDDFQCENATRSGVMLCVRNDGEKLYTDDEIESLRRKFKGVRVTKSDTTIKVPIWKWEKKREVKVKEIINEFSNYQVIITDRYHGTIFSQVANTPVIVLSSTDHKLSSGVKWFPKEVFGNMIKYALNLEEAYQIASKILENPITSSNPPYFKNKYYQNPL